MDKTKESNKKRPCGRQKTHGMYGTKFYSAYHMLNQRCNNPKNPRYPLYGGRGIKNEWPDFLSFLRDMYKSFKEHEAKYGGRQTSIDRIDNDKNYCKSNCRWATQSQQVSNRRKGV